jgi:hypothetical protein
VTLHDFLIANRGSWPAEGAIGVETDWLHLSEVRVTSGGIWVGDPGARNLADGCVVGVPEGTYKVEAKGIDFDGHHRVARLRARTKEGDGWYPVYSLTNRNVGVGIEVVFLGPETGDVEEIENPPSNDP